MVNETLYNYLNNTHQLDEASIYELTLLADKYPYFQTAQLLRVKNLHNISPQSIKPALNFTASYVTDRKVLYYLLHPIKELETREPQKPLEKEIKDTLEENISDTLSNQLNIGVESILPEIEFTTSFDVKKEYGEGVELEDYVVRISDEGPELIELIKEKEEHIALIEDKKPAISDPEEDLLLLINKGTPANINLDNDNLTDSQKKHNELIDNFIEKAPKIVPEASAKEVKDVSEGSVQENEHYLTDTLAQIYLKQGNYAKAIFAYEKLSLKYPEKNTYFAGQIAEIRKLLDNNK